MRTSSLFFATLLPALALAQTPGTPLSGTANIFVSSRDQTTLAETPVGCLTVDGQVAVNSTACAVFTLSDTKSSFGGTAVDAGAGACGRLPKNTGPLACNSTIASQAVLGFYVRALSAKPTTNTERRRADPGRKAGRGGAVHRMEPRRRADGEHERHAVLAGSSRSARRHVLEPSLIMLSRCMSECTTPSLVVQELDVRCASSTQPWATRMHT